MMFMAAVTMLFVGCDKMPTVDAMNNVSTTIGVSAGSVANLAKIDEQSRVVIVDIMTKISDVVPEVGKSFAETWTPIANEHVEKLLSENKITTVQKSVINGTFVVAVKGIDYIFDKRYPEARNYSELINTACHGFCNGFLSTFKSTALVSAVKPIKDEAAYQYLLQFSNAK